MLCAVIIAEKFYSTAITIIFLPPKYYGLQNVVSTFARNLQGLNFTYYYYVTQVEINFFKRERVTKP